MGHLVFVVETWHSGHPNQISSGFLLVFFGPVGSLVMAFSGAGCTGFSLGLFGRVMAFLTFCLWCSLCGMWACFSAVYILATQVKITDVSN